MAHVRDSDTSLWLHNKLGTSNDLWTGGSICSQLNQEVLRNIRECFIDLQSQVKLKLLLSFLHIPRRNVEEWKVELEEILEVALVDSDQWVSMLAELLKSYPSTGTLNFQVEENAPVFTDLATEIKKLVRKHSDQSILPLECLYLNKNSLNAVVGQLPQPVKHFALRRKPKSAALRAELLQKSSDAAANMRKTSTIPSVPIRCRGVTKNFSDTTPLRGIPNRTTPAGFKSPPSGISRLGSTAPPALGRPVPRTPAGRKDGGIKFLDITEQPIGYGRDAKRRKKQPEEVPDQPKKEKEDGSPVTYSPATPDYAAGLLSSSQLTGPSISISTPSGARDYAPSTPNSPLPPPTPTSVNATTLTTVPLSSSTAQTRENLQQSLQQTATAGTHLQTTTLTVSPETKPQTNNSLGPTQTQRPSAITTPASIGGTTTMQQQQSTTTAPPTATLQIHPPQPNQQQSQQQQQPQKKLQLSKEQMLEAQEMFKKANKVTRPEKALILGFMAGSRENPCPHLGNIVTIKLSENDENVQQPDGSVQTMIVETHFQMNYSTGEWKRIKKYRKKEEKPITE